MSKRDDDSQADMEVGMTTAERRRRRRRGGGLRVPSDNVPRRPSTPPVVAPVPEDPSLAMSIAYSFGSEPVEPLARSSAPTFEHHEAMSTVIDPVIDSVSGPVEQADFEMKTREMDAVDLEELGLQEAGASSVGMAAQRVSATAIEIPAVASGAPAAVDSSVLVDASYARYASQEPAPDHAFIRREATEPSELDVDVHTMDGLVDGSAAIEAVDDDPIAADAAGATDGGFPRADADRGAPDDGDDVSDGDDDGDDAPVERSAASELFDPPPLYRPARAQTVALSEEDLEEVREAARLATLPPTRPHSTSIPPPMPIKPVDARPRSVTPTSVPEIDLASLEERAAEASGEYEVDVDGIVDAKPVAAVAAPPRGPEPRPRPSPSQPPPLATASSAVPPAISPSSSSPSVVLPLGLSSSPSIVPPAVPPTAPPTMPPTIAPTTPSSLAGASSPSVLVPASAGRPRESQPMPAQRDPRDAQPSGQIPPPPPAPSLPRDSQPMAILREGGAPSASARESQPMAVTRDGSHAPPPPPAAHKAPPTPPPAKKDRPAPAVAAPMPKIDSKPARGKPWFVEVFDEDYLRTLPFLTPQATQAEAEFVIDAMGLQPGAQVLDVGCGYGRHAMELAARGFHVVGLDLSAPLLIRGGEEAHRRGLTINFVRGDMRELDFENQFDGAYCLFSTFGYFDDETNKKTLANIARALRPGGRVLIEILNRDYIIADLPTRVWWLGDGCVVLEEVDLNYFSSRIQVNRSVVFDDGRTVEQEISVRAYSLHEVGKLLHAAGFRVLEVSGAYHTRGRFFGNQSRHIIVLAERKDPSAT